MKTLYLIRHAHAEKIEATQEDFAKPLSEQGKQQAILIGKALQKLAIKPGVIIVSGAQRTIHTAEQLAEHIGYPKQQILSEPKLYQANALDVLPIITALDDEIQSAILVGHNPTFSELINYFCQTKGIALTPCTVCGIVFDCTSWQKLTDTSGRLCFYDTPAHYES